MSLRIASMTAWTFRHELRTTSFRAVVAEKWRIAAWMMIHESLNSLSEIT